MNNNLREAVEGFLTAVTGEVSPNTLRWYTQTLAPFVAFAGPDTPLPELTEATIYGYRAHLAGSGLSPHSIHGYQRAVRRLFSWLVERRMIDANIAARVKLVKLPTAEPKAVRAGDLDRLLEHLPRESVRDRAIILLLIDTGCRIGGLCSLTVHSVDIPARHATVMEKGAKARRIFFTDLTADALALYRAVRPAVATDALFLSERGGPLTDWGVRLMLKRVGERAGCTGPVNPHAFRHAFAREYLQNGGSLPGLGQTLGHQPGSRVTLSYAIFDDRSLREYHRLYSPLARLEP